MKRVALVLLAGFVFLTSGTAPSQAAAKCPRWKALDTTWTVTARKKVSCRAVRKVVHRIASGHENPHGWLCQTVDYGGGSGRPYIMYCGGTHKRTFTARAPTQPIAG
jgi:hypothetical protein